ncbi:PAS/PAC sensor signal transduction histidine kinase [Cellvibrio sp. BR]|uniref:PAS domain-containing protein n=1 Tax=unclassified Cellvibrio TaxID=2624793 RepID=UPI000260140C|nr:MULTISPECIES: PAS domain-containing protein [unclassified Cellvibrio]EIK43758.1 PAS/PAC sensor signal transduction histidine kinase [Cellvibrio sp. BR]QEY14189.1 PAS domain S-box protein [Cellvibrio sp. KY-YJ-3]
MTDPFSPFPFVSRTLCGWASVVGLVAVFITDWFTPLGFGHGMLYSPLILLALVSGSRALVLGVALCAILFTLIGMLMSPDAPDIPTINTVFANRVLSILLIVFTTGLSLWLLINVQRLNSATEKLMATQQRLSEQHHLLRIASQVGHLGGWTVTVPEEQVSWTDEVANMHHLPPGYHPSVEEALNFYHPDYREHVRKLVRDCMEQGIAFDDEVQLLTSDNEVLWVRIMGTALRDQQDKVIRIQGAIQDISQRKQVENLIKLSHEKFSNLADAMPIAVWSAQANGVVDYVNRALSDYSGLAVEELVQPGRWLSILHPDDYDRAEAYWSESVDTGMDYVIEFRIRRKDGEYRWHLTRAQPVRNEQGIITKWYGGTVDIHEHKMLEREHQLIVDRLLQSLKSS